MFVATPLFPGLLNDSASRFAADLAQHPLALASAWASARALGWDGLLVPEARGGSGGTLHDLAAIVEALGAHGEALPVAQRCGAAPLLLAASPQSDAAQALLAELAAQRAQVAWLHGSERSPLLSVEALPATHYLASPPRTRQLVLLRAAQMPAPTEQWRAVDGLPIDGYAPDSLPWHDAVLLNDDGAQPEADTLSLLMGCVESVAAIGSLISQTTAHLGHRTQFGVALASFQVLRHKVVDMYVKYEAARGLVVDCVQRAALDLATVRSDARLAQLYVGEAGRFAAETAVQLHGAIGMSEELPVARLCKRLLANEFRHGDGLLHSVALTDELRQRAGTFH